MTREPADWIFEEPSAPPGDGRLFAPAAARNAAPLAAALARVLPGSGRVLELASGTGQHAAYLAGLFPDLVWQPSDPDPAARQSVEAWRRAAGPSNLEPVLALDATNEDWAGGLEGVAAVLCINMIHIAPWQACLGLLGGAGRLLPPAGPLILYGPFRRAGRPTAPSNEAFDRSLRLRNPRWGLRTLETVAEAAAPHGLELDEVIEMPANNLTVVFRRRPDSAPGEKAL